MNEKKNSEKILSTKKKAAHTRKKKRLIETNTKKEKNPGKRNVESTLILLHKLPFKTN